MPNVEYRAAHVDEEIYPIFVFVSVNGAVSADLSYNVSQHCAFDVCVGACAVQCAVCKLYGRRSEYNINRRKI